MVCDHGARPLFLALETIIAFAWEPNGSKFAVLHGEAPRISVSFYHVKSNGKIELISKRLSGSPGAELGYCSWESAWLDRASCGQLVVGEGVCCKGQAFCALPSSGVCGIVIL